MQRFLLTITCLLVLAVTVHSGEPGDDAKATLDEVNQAFIAAHAAANARDLATGGPLLLLIDDQLILVRNGQETAVNFVPPEFDTYKVFAHMPVAICLMLQPAGAIDGDRLEALRGYAGRLDRLTRHIDQIGLSGQELDRQQNMLRCAREFVGSVIRDQQVVPDGLSMFARTMRPWIEANIAAAAKSQLDGMHRQMIQWRREMTADEWKRIRVALKGAVLARNGSLAKQYFEKLLHLDGEGQRLVYMEGYYPPTPMQTLLATRAVDRDISMAIFDSPDRMFRDVLADAAAAYLREMNFDGF